MADPPSDEASRRAPPWHDVLIDGGHAENAGSNGDTPVPGPRAELRDVSFTHAGIGGEVRVTLAVGERTFVGSSRCVAAPHARRAAVARATADAVNQLIDPAGRVEVLSLETLTCPNVPDRVACSLILVTPAESDLLVGVAVEGERPETGIARATLAALNRRLTIYRN